MMYDSDYQDLVTASLGHRNTKHTPISGINQYGLQQVWELVETVNANGQGGRANSDGENACVYHFSPSADTLDVELQETQLPILYLFRNLMPDNHGFGKHRGGTGVQFGVMLHNVPSFTAIARGQGSKFPIDTGLFGGYAGGTGPAISVRNTNLKKLLKDSDMDIPRGIAELLEKRHIKGDYSITEPNMYWTMREGDLIANYSSSGAGFGDPLERDPEDVLRDLRQGIISFKVSQEVYKVVFSNRHSLQLDLKKTAKARKKARQARLETARPYHEFIMEWSKKRPPAEAMATLGPWPKKA
jgi:acetophenone carboxylase